MKKLLLMVLLLLPCFVTTCYAEDLAESAGIEWGVDAVEQALPDEAREIGGTLTLNGDYDAGGALERLWQSFLNSCRERLRAEWKSMTRILALTVLTSVFSVLCPDQKAKAYAQIGACAAASLLAAGGVESVVTQALDAMNQLNDYSKAAMPAVFTVAAAGGAVVSAAAKYGAACLALDMLMNVSRRLILPAIYAYLALTVCLSVFDHPILRTAAGMTKKLTVWMLSAMTLAFTVYIGLTGLVTGSADAAAVKATKTLISTVVPVVGGILADAASSVLAAASVIKGSAGAFSLVGVCALCASPFAALFVKLLMFRVSAALAEMAPGAGLSRLLSSLASAMSMLLAMVGAFGFMLFFSLMSAIRVVTV